MFFRLLTRSNKYLPIKKLKWSINCDSAARELVSAKLIDYIHLETSELTKLFNKKEMIDFIKESNTNLTCQTKVYPGYFILG